MFTVASWDVVEVATQIQLVQRAAEATASEVGPGLIAFTIVVLLAIATFFLVRSMMHHIGKVPPTFDGPADGPADDPADDPAGDTSSRDVS